MAYSSPRSRSSRVPPAPAVEHVLRRAPVQPAVDLRAAAGAAPLGVGDRWTAERRGHAAGAVLAVHLLQRERDDVALAHERALLDDEDVEAGLGEQRRRRRTAGAGADDEHVGGRRQAIDRRQRAAAITEGARRLPCPATSPTRRRRRASGRGGRSRRRRAADGGRASGRAAATGEAAGERRRRWRRRRRRRASATASGEPPAGERTGSGAALGRGREVDGGEVDGRCEERARSAKARRRSVTASRRGRVRPAWGTVAGSDSARCGLVVGSPPADQGSGRPCRPSMTSPPTCAPPGSAHPRAGLARPRRSRRRRVGGPRRRVHAAVGGGRARRRPPHVGCRRRAAGPGTAPRLRRDPPGSRYSVFPRAAAPSCSGGWGAPTPRRGVERRAVVLAGLVPPAAPDDRPPRPRPDVGPDDAAAAGRRSGAPGGAAGAAVLPARPTVTPSEATREELLELGFRPDRVTAGAQRRRRVLHARRSSAGPSPLVLAVGRFAPVKRFHLALEAAARHGGRCPICACGSSATVRWPASCGVGRRPRRLRLGRVRRLRRPPPLPDEYRRAWVVLSASLAEGWGWR